MAKFKKFKDSYYNYLLYALLIFHTIAYITFRLLNKSYQTWDSAGHISLTYNIANKLKLLSVPNQMSVLELLKTSPYYPPLMHTLAAFLTLIIGKNNQVLLALVFIMFLISIWVLYKLVLLLKLSPQTAFWSAFFYSMFPLVVDQARLFHLEIPLILSTLVSYILMIKSNKFLNTKYTILFGISVGIAQLIKWYGVLYLFVPGLYLLYLGIKTKEYKKIVINLSLAVFVAVIIFFPWYIANLKSIRILSKLFSQGESDDPQKLLSIENLTFYYRNLISTQIYIWPTILSILGIGYLIKKKKIYGLLALAHIIFIITLFTFIKNKNTRYTMILLPVFAVTIGYFLTQIKYKFVLYLSVIVVVIAFLFASFNQLKGRSNMSKMAGIVFAGPFYDDIQVSPRMYSYTPFKPDIDSIYRYVIIDAKTHNVGKKLGITPLIDSRDISTATLEMVRLEDDLENVFLPVPYFRFEPFKSDYEILKYLADKNVYYVLVPDYIGPSGLRNYETLKQMKEFFETPKRSSKWFTPIRRIETQNNAVTVYRRNEIPATYKLNYCDTIEPIGGTFNITVQPLSSLIIFTGNYQYQNIKANYQYGTLQILEIDNPTLDSKNVNITNLPESGISFCHRLGTKPKLQKEFAEALLSNQSACGALPCKEIKYVKTTTDGEILKQETFTKDDFAGKGIDKLLKKTKVLPVYDKEDSILDEIFYEFK